MSPMSRRQGSYPVHPPSGIAHPASHAWHNGFPPERDHPPFWEWFHTMPPTGLVELMSLSRENVMSGSPFSFFCALAQIGLKFPKIGRSAHFSQAAFRSASS